MTQYRAHLYNRSSRDREPSSLARGLWATTKLTVFLAVVGTAGWLFFQDQVQSRLRATVEDKCNSALAGSGVEASIGEARFFDGQGMLLTNMQATAPNISLTAYETFLTMPSNTTELVTGKIAVDGIEMRRVQLEVVRADNASFDWSVLSKLVEAIQNSNNGSPTRLVPVAMLDSQIRFVDQTTGIEKTVSDINLRLNPVEHNGRTILEFVLTAAAVEVKQFTLKGFVDPESGEWRADLGLNDALIGSELVAILPRSVQQKMNGFQSASSRINGSLYAQGNWKMNEVRWFEGSGNIANFSLQHQALPSAIRNASGTWEFSPDGAIIENIRGHLGSSPFNAQFHTGSLKGPLAWRFNGQLDQLELDNTEHSIRAMPPKTHQFLRDFKPRGVFDIQFDFQFDGQQIRKTVDAQISNLAFNFIRFPYPLTNCSGVARWIDDRITYDLKHETGQRVLSAKGVVINPGKQAIWRCGISVDKGQLSFDEPLQTAIDANPDMARIVRAFNGHGWITGSGILERQTPGGEVQKRFNIDVVDLTIRHDKFPYTIEGVRGKIRSINKSFRFEQLSGSSGAGTILCDGSWNPMEGLNVHYQCSNIQLDERLRRALRPELQDVWDGFRPRGTVEAMAVDMTLAPGEADVELVVNATLNGENEGIRTSNLSINPTWFPYELNNLAGKLVVGHGKVNLREFQGQHGRTTVVCNGDGSYSNEGWDVRLSDLLALSLRADGPLLRALPESLARPIEFMKFDGLLNVQGTVTLAGQYRKPTLQYASNIPNHLQTQRQIGSSVQQTSAIETVDYDRNNPRVSMGWDARFDMNQAELFLGIPVKNVFGMFELIGQFDGENVECRGSVDLDSLTVYDAQITQVRGPVWFDNYQALAGGMINQVSNSETKSPSIRGQMYGGMVQLDAAISSDQEGRFLIHTSLADGNLRQLSKEFSPSSEDIDGRTFAALTMQGNASGTHTCRGNGAVHLRDAKIYELPPVMRLLNLFRVKRVNDVAFDSGDIYFNVTGENIDINRMEFNGDAISIIGNGRMNMDHDIDLNFYSVMGRNKINIPLISDLYRRSSQKFMWINVGGTCQDPKINTEILPELNDSLRQLFKQDVR